MHMHMSHVHVHVRVHVHVHVHVMRGVWGVCVCEVCGGVCVLTVGWGGCCGVCAWFVPGACLQHRPHVPQRRLHLGELDRGDPERPDVGEATVRPLGDDLVRVRVRVRIRVRVRVRG